MSYACAAATSAAPSVAGQAGEWLLVIATCRAPAARSADAASPWPE